MNCITNKCLIDLQISYADLTSHQTEIHGLLIVNDYVPVEYVPRKGIVKSIPMQLRFMQWKTSIDITVGDEVFMIYRPVLNALGRLANPIKPENENNPAWIELDGTVHVLIDYKDLIFAKRNDKIIMLNGRILVKTLERKYQKTKLEYVRSNKRVPNMLGVVRYSGKTNEKYLESIWKDAEDIREGYVLYYQMTEAIRLESDMIKILNEDLNYMFQRNIIYMWKPEDAAKYNFEFDENEKLVLTLK